MIPVYGYEPSSRTMVFDKETILDFRLSKSPKNEINSPALFV